MNKAITQNYVLTDAELAEFKALTTPPDIAWPTIVLMVVGWTVLITSDVLGVRGVWPLWACALVNGVAGYLMFSAIHDSIHRAVSTNTSLNDWVGRIALLSLSPTTSIGLFRWGHAQHHRFSVSEQDPDRWTYEGPKWLLPLRWITIDYWYFVMVVRSNDKVAKRHMKSAMGSFAATLSVIVALVWTGYGLEVLMLWYIPSRIAAGLLGFSFFWLPHEPHDVSQAENFTRASTIRLGYEWLMTPLLQYQNYHLLHHLHPRTPFYNNGKLWRLLESNLRRYDLAIQQGFAIKPDIIQGSQ